MRIRSRNPACITVFIVIFIFFYIPTSPYCIEGGGGECVLMYSNKYPTNLKNTPFSVKVPGLCEGGRHLGRHRLRGCGLGQGEQGHPTLPGNPLFAFHPHLVSSISHFLCSSIYVLDPFWEFSLTTCWRFFFNIIARKRFFFIIIARSRFFFIVIARRRFLFNTV